MSEALKSCPFCGGDEARLYCVDGWWFVRCAQLACQAAAYPFCADENEAVEEWNRRAPATRLVELLDAYTNAIREEDWAVQRHLDDDSAPSVEGARAAILAEFRAPHLCAYCSSPLGEGDDFGLHRPCFAEIAAARFASAVVSGRSNE